MKLKGKKILVTGADGFIGSHLVEALLKNEYDVRAFVYYNSFNSWGWLDTLPKEKLANLDIFMGDIRDPNGVSQAMLGCDVVFHLAALIAIPFSYHSPDSYLDTNIKGTLNVLQGARAYNTERIIITSTSEVYGTAQYTPIDEKHPYQAQSPYSATKIASDCLAKSFYHSFQTPVVIARPFNTYGPRQSARAVIPTVMTQLLTGQKILKLGCTSTTRDFNYVEDTAQGFIALAEADSAIGEEVNIATGKEYTIHEVAQQLISQINPLASIITDEQRLRPETSEVFRLVGDNKKISTLTNWQPSYDLESGLRETISWFKKTENILKYKAWVYNI
ncbi:MAG: NAD-dependent 4,6-dehydratase LegB [Legionellaceae bacterium]|nr:NAD-dependent 4,6-dehydratase LegB [Legionellaceae bacterium]